MTDQELLDFVGAFRSGLLAGRPSMMMCYAVCWPLGSLLRANGVETELVKGRNGHHWLRLPDSRVLDPTADQYNRRRDIRPKFPPVYLGPPTRIHQELPE